MKRTLSFLALALLVAIISPAQSFPSTTSTVLVFDTCSYPAGGFASSICVADFDNDGHLDMAVANRDSNSISILKNSGNGTFTAPVHYSVGTGPRFLVAFDFDEDGNQDLVVANTDTNTVYLMKNNGAGSFSKSASFIIKRNPYYILVDDISGRPNPDISVQYITNGYYRSMCVLDNNGDGTFTNSGWQGMSGAYCRIHGYFASSGSNSATQHDLIYLHHWGFPSFATYDIGYYIGIGSICSADVNRDGRLDIITANSSKSVAILTQKTIELNGNDDFWRPNFFPLDNAGTFVTTADFDHDGAPDLLVVKSSANNISILRNMGYGGFEPEVNFAVGNYPVYACSGDFNGDGTIDIAVANSNSNTVTVLYNYTSQATAVEEIGGPLPTQFALGQNYPNPFNPATTITYSIPKETNVFLVVYNIIGQEVARLVDIHQRAGNYSVSWDASEQPSGIYLYRIQTDQADETRKMLLLK